MTDSHVDAVRRCARCGGDMAGYRAGTKWCSRGCRLADRRELRRGIPARGKGRHGLTWQAVFDLYDWTCHICGESIEDGLRRPDPKSPSIDHVIPVAAGGGHEMENLRPAHLGCNVIKGAA